MRFHFGVSFSLKKALKWILFIFISILSFLGVYKVHALSQFSVDVHNVTGDIKESYYVCNAETDTCDFITDNTNSSWGSIPWTSAEIPGQDYSSVSEYMVTAIRVFGMTFYNSTSVNTTIPANSLVTISIQFSNLDKFTKGPNFNNPSIALRNTSNGWTYGSYNPSFVCNKNSCTLTYKTPNVTTKGVFVYWNVNSTDYSNYFVRNDTSIDYKLGVTGYTFTYDNSTADTSNAINNQTQIQISWFSTLNESIKKTSDDMINSLKKSSDLQDKTNDLISDSSIDDKSSFFNNFNDNDHGISSIVSAPLVLVRGLNSGTSCEPLTFDILGKSVSIPSGCVLWDKVPTEVETIYFVFVGGFFAFILGTKLFHDIDDLKNPENSEVSTLDL